MPFEDDMAQLSSFNWPAQLGRLARFVATPAIALTLATLLPLLDLWICLAPPWPEHWVVVVFMTVPVPLATYLLARPFFTCPRRLKQYLPLSLIVAGVALVAYFFLSARFIHELDDRFHRDVGGWAYTARALRDKGRNPSLTDLELLHRNESKEERVFSSSSIAVARALLLLTWIVLAASLSLALALALFLNRQRELDARIGSLVPEIDASIRTDLQTALHTLRDSKNANLVILSLSQLSLKMLDILFAWCGETRPSDNLHQCIIRASTSIPEYPKLKGLDVMPRRMAEYLDTIRVCANRVDHVLPGPPPTLYEAEINLNMYLAVLEWLYCQCEKNPHRLASIYTGPQATEGM